MRRSRITSPMARAITVPGNGYVAYAHLTSHQLLYLHRDYLSTGTIYAPKLATHRNWPCTEIGHAPQPQWTCITGPMWHPNQFFTSGVVSVSNTWAL